LLVDLIDPTPSQKYPWKLVPSARTLFGLNNAANNTRN
jgi:hypothetical protein